MQEDTLIQLLQELKLNLVFDGSLKQLKTEDIAPTNKILVIRLLDSKYTLSMVNWGFKFKLDSPLIFNSRIETIKEKKYWLTLFDKNRCIVPMTSFYEWKAEGNRKEKYRIFLPDQKIFFVPALFYIDKDKNIFTSFITTTPNKLIKSIHHRMPVILALKDAFSYLNNPLNKNLELCIPYSDNKLIEIQAV